MWSIITTNTFTTKACREVFKIQSGSLNCNSEKFFYFWDGKFVMILPMLERLKLIFVFDLIITKVITECMFLSCHIHFLEWIYTLFDSVVVWMFSYLAKWPVLLKCLSFRLRTKWFQVRIPFQWTPIFSKRKTVCTTEAFSFTVYSRLPQRYSWFGSNFICKSVKRTNNLQKGKLFDNSNWKHFTHLV